MRWALLLFIIPGVANASDTIIRVEYVLRQERVKPEPKIVTTKIEQRFVLHENGRVEETFSIGGKHPHTSRRSSALGEELKVRNASTVKRVWKVGAQTRELTISTQGANCVATMEIKNGAGEFNPSWSTRLCWFRPE